MSKALKLLVCGDVHGRFAQLFSRVGNIQKKAGQFDMLFCVGNFFGNDDSEWQQVISGTIKVPIATFVLGPNKPENVKYFTNAGGCELCENITYLGRRGLYTGSSGLTVAYLSGTETSSSGGGGEAAGDDTHFTAVDVDDLRQSLTGVGQFRGVDLLLTSQWPRGVDKYATAAEGVDSNTTGSALISQLALSLKPRYHFCVCEGVSYERQPYRNHRVLMEAAQHVTRFIALADVSTEHKRKYLYAFNVIPLRHMDLAELTKQPPDVTECPYKIDNSLFKATRPAVDTKSAQYFYDARVIERGSTLPERGKRKSFNAGPPAKKPAQPSGPCWFCLASPEVEKHLVVSVGTQCYLALAKGGLTNEHVLILPIGHYQSTVMAPSDVVDEIEKYKSALRKYFTKSNQSVVFFERNYKTQHLQIQVVPVSASGADVTTAFMSCAERQNIELREIPTFSDLKQIVPSGAPYFYAEIPGGVKLYCQISRGFSLHFGREAMAHTSLLNMPDRVDWKQCTSSKSQEAENASSFRQKFRKFDFTLD